MIYSMTGYGKAARSKKRFTVETELKSINSRYLEVYLKLPPALYMYELEIRELLRSKLKRGKINLIVQLKTDSSENSISVIDRNKLKTYLKQVDEIKKIAKIKDEIKLEHILSSKEITGSGEIELNASDFQFVKSTINEAIKDLYKMKADEGGELTKDISKRLKNIESQIVFIEQEFKKGITEYHQNLKARVQELIADSNFDTERLNTELALIADKADITEECVRLKSHIKFFIEIMKKEDEPGRKLNFLCQEINREANTIGSKSVTTEIIHKAVVIKEEVEKIREQIQNIE